MPSPKASHLVIKDLVKSDRSKTSGIDEVVLSSLKACKVLSVQ